MDILSISLGAKKALEQLGIRSDKSKSAILENTKIDFTDGQNDGSTGGEFQENATYQVEWDGVKYTCKSYTMEMDGQTGHI